MKIQSVEVRKEECRYYYVKQSTMGLLLRMKSLILQVYHYTCSCCASLSLSWHATVTLGDCGAVTTLCVQHC